MIMLDFFVYLCVCQRLSSTNSEYNFFLVLMKQDNIPQAKLYKCVNIFQQHHRRYEEWTYNITVIQNW